VQKKIIFLIFFYISCSFFSQEILIPKKILKSYNDGGSIFLFSKNEQLKIDIDKYEISKLKDFNNNGYNIANYYILKIRDTFYFVQNTGGLVLELKDNALERIDNSFNHKMQINSSIFEYNNEIYRYGGYGYFSTRDFIVKFDFDTLEWESIKINDAPLPIGRFNNFYDVYNDNLIVIGGTTVNKLDKEKRILLNDIWKFSFKEMKWTYLLNDPEITSVDSNTLKFHNNILYRDSQQIKVLNLDSYELKSFDVNNSYLKINNNFKTHFHNNNFHFVVNRNNGKRVLIKRTKKELFGRINTKKDIVNKNYLTLENILIIGLLVFIILVILLFRRYLNSIFLYPEKIKYRNKIVFISDDEYLVLKGFIENQNTLENNILQALLNKDQYHNSHNIRRKNNLVNNLNSKLKILFNDNNINFIEIYKSEFDKRYKKYLLYSKDLKIVIK
jgi:hypothetical protein